jgi:hypothetical protein
MAKKETLLRKASAGKLSNPPHRVLQSTHGGL